MSTAKSAEKVVQDIRPNRSRAPSRNLTDLGARSFLRSTALDKLSITSYGQTDASTIPRPSVVSRTAKRTLPTDRSNAGSLVPAKKPLNATNKAWF